MKISFILNNKGTQVYSALPENTLKEALANMQEHKIGSLVVLNDKGELVGILTDRDTLHAVYEKGADWSDVQVGSAMTTNVVTVTQEDKVDYAMDLMTSNRIRHLVVKDKDNKVGGVLSMGDIIKANLDETKFQNELLKNFIKNWPDQ